jgi:isopentenyl-diphosphate delta-isomerase type 1
VVDAEDSLLGQATRREVHARGLRHRAVHVLIFDSQARLYLQRRSPGKDTHPGKWTSSASGHVDFGESYDQSARRETREELGLSLRPVYLGKLPAQPATDNEFVCVYLAHTREPPRPDPVEISEIRLFTQEQALALAADPQRACPSLAPALALLLSEKAWPNSAPAKGKRKNPPPVEAKKAP